jgi:hypothetical protein
MALTYPRQLLEGFDFEDFTLELVDFVSFSRADEGRVVSTVQYSEPYWRLTISTEPLDQLDRRRWSAWYNSLRGGLQGFLTWDLSRAYPAAYVDQTTGRGYIPYLHTSPPWDGEGTLSSIAAHEMVCEGAPLGFQLTDGDLIGLVEDGRRHVFEVAEACAVVSGGTITVPVNPAVPLEAFTAAATVVFYRPQLLMKVVPGTFVCPAVGGGSANVTFEAVQII